MKAPGITTAYIQRVIKKGNWIVRMDNDGVSLSPDANGFKWQPPGKWTIAPDWDEKPQCGGGLHGQDSENSGFAISGNRLVFCETNGKHIVIDKDKVKVQAARILMINELPRNLIFFGSLDLQGCTGLTALPDGLTVDGWLYLQGCTGLTALPNGLTMGGWLFINNQRMMI